MATASVTNSFSASTTIESAKMNTNFTDLVTFLNASVVHVDGSQAITGAQTIQGLLTVDSIVPEADVSDSLGTAALSWLDLFVNLIKDNAGQVVIDVENAEIDVTMAPNADGTLDWGSSSAAWADVFADQFRANAEGATGAGNGAFSVLSLFNIYSDDNLNQTKLENVDTGGKTLIIGAVALAPGDDDATDLGSGSLRFDDVFATNATIQTSDPAQKVAIQAIGQDDIDVLKAMGGISFKWAGGGARRHWGFDADEAKAALDNKGIDRAFYVDPAVNPDKMEPTGKDNQGNPQKPQNPAKGLRVGEVVPVLLEYVKQLEARIEALEV